MAARQSQLDELAEARDALLRETRRRNRLILALRLEGYPWTRIAELSGLTVNGAERVATRENKGVRPVPKQLK